MDANESFQKALFLLDRGDVVRGENLLREVIAAMESRKDVLYYQACCCLGELLIELGRAAEASPLLEQIAALGADCPDAEVLSYEIQRAESLLAF